MAEKPSEETIARMHRWFAVECNNAAWDLAGKPDRSEEQDRELLYRAYTAAFHWSNAGTPLNAARAEVLLSHAHGLLGHADLARRYAEKATAFFAQGNGEDWDLAFANAVSAQAAAAANDRAAYANLHARAAEQGASIQKPGERKAFDAFFAKLKLPAR